MTEASPMLPVLGDHDTGEFFAAWDRGELVVRSCASCATDVHLPRARCTACGSVSRAWRTVAGRGTVHSWTVVEHQVHPAYPVPYTVLLVDVDDTDGVRLLGHLPGRVDVGVGDAVVLDFERLGDRVLATWRPARRTT